MLDGQKLKNQNVLHTDNLFYHTLKFDTKQLLLQGEVNPKNSLLVKCWNPTVNRLKRSWALANNN